MSENLEIMQSIAGAWNEEDYSTALRLLKRHPEHLRNERGEEQWMWWAATDGNLPLIQGLVELGVGVNESSNLGDPNHWSYQPEGAIIHAAGEGHLEVVRWLLDHGAKLNYVIQGRSCCRALMRAARDDDRLDVVKLLVERGADIHADWNNMTAVTEAEIYGAYEVRDYLISLGGKDIREIIPPDYPGAHQELLETMHEHFGPVGDWRREIPGDPLVTIHHIPANEKCEASQILFTVGLGDRYLSFRRIRFHAVEMRLQLPPDWPLDEESLKDSRWNWPLARFEELIKQVRSTATWFPGEVVWNGDPPQPLHPETELCAWAVINHHGLWMKDKRVITQYELFPVYEEEARFVERECHEELMAKFQEAEVPMYVDPHREVIDME